MTEASTSGTLSTDAVLPPLFAGWMQALLPGSIPAERNATCDRCAMVAPTEPVDGGLYFSPSTKCCTFHPEVANFLVGGILGDTDPASRPGRETVEARIDKGVGVSPLGLQRTEVYTLMYRASQHAFGQARSMRCPHYLDVEGGLCGIWRHRESTCATWFCKFGRGEKGRTFWKRLHETLLAAEDTLRMHCLAQVGVDAEALASLFPPHAFTSVAPGDGLSASDLDGSINPVAYRARWGKWHGRERELYLACAEIVRPLGWTDVARLGGARVELLGRLLVDAYRELVSTEVPARVRHRQLKIVYTSEQSAEVVGYSPLDPLSVPKKFLDVLHHFDGRPTADVLREIDDRHELRVAPGVVRKLVDFGVLSAVDETLEASRSTK